MLIVPKVVPKVFLPPRFVGDDLIGSVVLANFAAPPLPPLPPPVQNEVPPVQNEVVADVDGGAVQVSVAIDGGAPANGGDPHVPGNHPLSCGPTTSRGSSASRRPPNNRALSTSTSSQKTKNSNNKNKDRTSVAGAIVKLCESFKDRGTARNDDSTREMMNIIMMNQMSMMGACMEHQERKERKEERRERKHAKKRKMKRMAKKRQREQQRRP